MKSPMIPKAAPKEHPRDPKPALAARKISTSSIGLGDHLIDVIAIDALKRAQLESDARGLDTRQDHWSQTFGTGVGLNRYAA